MHIFFIILLGQTFEWLWQDRIAINGETHRKNILSSPRWRQSSTTHRAKIKQDITRNHKHTLSQTHTLVDFDLNHAALHLKYCSLPAPPTQGTSSSVWKSQEINQCLRLHFHHLSHGRPAVPSQHNAVESQQWIDKAEEIKTCKECKFASLRVCGWKWSYLAADDEGTLKKPALRLESLHFSSSLMRRWPRRTTSLCRNTFFPPSSTHKQCLCLWGELFSANSHFLFAF